MIIVEITDKTLNEYYELVAQAKAMGKIGHDFDFEYVASQWEDELGLTLKKGRHLKFYFYTEELALFFKLKHD
jgi:hypothetical protein